MQSAPTVAAKLVMLLQWRAGLRVSEALDVRPEDLRLGASPTLRVRQGKGGKARIVPIHPELQLALSWVPRRPGAPLVEAARGTVWRWVKEAQARAVALGVDLAGRRIGTHTLRHSYARHLLMNGVPINALSRWLGHANLSTTLVYLELVPDPAGSLARVP